MLGKRWRELFSAFSAKTFPNRAGTMSSANFLVETDSGELFVSFPRAIAKQVIAIVHGSQEVAR